MGVEACVVVVSATNRLPAGQLAPRFGASWAEGLKSVEAKLTAIGQRLNKTAQTSPASRV